MARGRQYRALELAKPKRRGFSAGRAIELEIAAAHSGRLDFDDDVMGPGRRIGKFGDLQFASAQKAHPVHHVLLELPMRISHARSVAGNRCKFIAGIAWCARRGAR